MDQIVARVPPETVAALDSLAADAGLRRSDIIRAALRHYLSGPVVTVSGDLRRETGDALNQVRGGTPTPADLSIPAPTGDVTKAIAPETSALDAIPGVVRASSLPQPERRTVEPRFTDRQKGGKK